MARHLFGEYERQQPHASQRNNLPQQVTPNDVSHCTDSSQAYILTCISPQQPQQPHTSQGLSLLQQVGNQDVRLCTTSIYAHILTYTQINRTAPARTGLYHE